jgi:hypothetical protein
LLSKIEVREVKCEVVSMYPAPPKSHQDNRVHSITIELRANGFAIITYNKQKKITKEMAPFSHFRCMSIFLYKFWSFGGRKAFKF